MTREALMAYCLAKPGAWLDQPWEEDSVVKVGSRIFAFLGSGTSPATVGLKCGRSREEADEWLVRYPDDASVLPYIGRSGWKLLEAVDASYDAVVSKLPKRERPTGT
jgi:predicted DNA-binding protein (MmcQ/YjbR family)